MPSPVLSMNQVAASSQISEATPGCESAANAIRRALVQGYVAAGAVAGYSLLSIP
jgi:hypothetical protein